MSFRFWCREKWYEYLAEHDAYRIIAPLDSNQYFKMYKYWLKREYKYQLGAKND